MSSSTAIAAWAGIIGLLIQQIASMLGEPIDDVRMRVMAQVAKDARDQSDETDPVLQQIIDSMPE